MKLQLETYPASKRSSLEKFEDFHFLTNWNEIEYDGWILPGTKEKHDWCGLWQTKGCLNVEGHQKQYEQKIFVKQYRRSCFRSMCKECYKKWIGRESNKATRRIEKFEEVSGKNAKHIILSVPSWDCGLSLKELRKKAYPILREIGCIGGTFIFHPFRFNSDSRRWYYSPHFHVIGFGWIIGSNVSDSYQKNGWIIKNKGFRDSVFATFYYQLSHCGVRKGFHALTWFGDLSYSKLKLEKEPDTSVCPACQRKLIPIYYDGVHSGIPPDEEGGYFVDSSDWYEVKTIQVDEWKEPTFEYHSTAHLNHILEAISIN